MILTFLRPFVTIGLYNGLNSHCPYYTKITRPDYFCFYCLWYVTLRFLSPRVMPAVLSLAATAPCSASYSTNAMPRRPGTTRTSRKPSKRAKMPVSASTSYSSATFCKKRILLGGRYSSGMTAACATDVDLRPEGLAILDGRPSAAAPTATAPRFPGRGPSAASMAFFFSANFPFC